MAKSCHDIDWLRYVVGKKFKYARDKEKKGNENRQATRRGGGEEVGV